MVQRRELSAISLPVRAQYGHMYPDFFASSTFQPRAYMEHKSNCNTERPARQLFRTFGLFFQRHFPAAGQDSSTAMRCGA